MQTQPIPSRIERHSFSEMLLEWNTGDRYAVPFFEIRFYCPCAGCVDEHTGQRTVDRGSLKRDIQPVKVELVGKYAVHILWNDGHSTGIYHFDRLFELSQKQGRKLGDPSGL